MIVPDPTVPPTEVVARQVALFEDNIFLIDAGGQLWWKSLSAVRLMPSLPWTRVSLPAVDV